jgi:hypothetical protein
MRFKPKIGRDFPITKAVIAELTRSTIAVGFMAVATLALAFAAAYGARVGEFGALQAVWGVVAAPFGWILKDYFRGTRDDGEDDDDEGAA